MKRCCIIYLCILLSLLFSSSAEKKCFSVDRELGLTLQQQADTLCSLYKIMTDEAIMSSQRIESERLFFYFFPSSFERFSKLYGYTDKPMPLYFDAEKHLFGGICHLKHINLDDYLCKLVSIGIGGVWQADGVNILQSILHDEVSTYISEVVAILLTYDSDKIYKFWHFFYDGPHPENYKTDYEVLHFKLLSIDCDIASIQKSAFLSVLRES